MILETSISDVREELTDLLERQVRTQSEPDGQCNFEELKDIMIAKAFSGDERR